MTPFFVGITRLLVILSSSSPGLLCVTVTRGCHPGPGFINHWRNHYHNSWHLCVIMAASFTVLHGLSLDTWSNQWLLLFINSLIVVLELMNCVFNKCKEAAMIWRKMYRCRKWVHSAWWSPRPWSPSSSHHSSPVIVITATHTVGTRGVFSKLSVFVIQYEASFVETYTHKYWIKWE